MMKIVLLLLFLVEVHCQQTFPYVSFGLAGQALVNHSYVDLSTVGSDYINNVVCHTDLNTCCSVSQGPHRGDWYFPDRTRLPFSGAIYEGRGPQTVFLRHRTTATGPTGIYHCGVSTNAVHDDDDERATVYVGLYTTSGGKLSPWYMYYLRMKGYPRVCQCSCFAEVLHEHILKGGATMKVLMSHLPCWDHVDYVPESKQ